MDLAQKCWLTNMPTLQRQILVLPTRHVHIGQVPSDTVWCAWLSSRDADVGRRTEKVRSEEALYIAPNSNITPLGLFRDPRPELEKYSAPRILFSDWVMEECCPDLANSQHREDMSKAPPSLTIGSVVSAVFGGRWACAHLAANAGVGRTRAVAREDSKPASAINSFKLLCTTPHFF